MRGLGDVADGQRRRALVVGQHTKVHLGPAARGHLVVVGDRGPGGGRCLDGDEDTRRRLTAGRVAHRVGELVRAFKPGAAEYMQPPSGAQLTDPWAPWEFRDDCDRIAIEVLVVGEHVEHARRRGVEQVVVTLRVRSAREWRRPPGSWSPSRPGRR